MISTQHPSNTVKWIHTVHADSYPLFSFVSHARLLTVLFSKFANSANTIVNNGMSNFFSNFKMMRFGLYFQINIWKMENIIEIKNSFLRYPHYLRLNREISLQNMNSFVMLKWKIEILERQKLKIEMETPFAT